MDDSMNVESESSLKRTWMLALKLIGGASWFLAYREAIAEAEARGKPLLPSSAVALNLAWETIYSVGGLIKWRNLTLEDRVQTAINTVWLFSDIRWARALRSHNIYVSRSATIAALVYQLAFLARWRPGEAARISALWQNLAFSAYCSMAQPIEQVGGRTARFTALRAVGTAIPTLTSGILRGYRPKYLLPGIICIYCDLYRLAKQRKVAAGR